MSIIIIGVKCELLDENRIFNYRHLRFFIYFVYYKNNDIIRLQFSRYLPSLRYFSLVYRWRNLRNY